MRIISKYTDYYDKISHIYGVDEKIVFDRNYPIPHFVDVYVPDEHYIRVPSVSTHTSRNASPNTRAYDNLCLQHGISGFTLLSVCARPFYIGETSGGLIWVDQPVIANAGWRQHADLSPKKYLAKIHQSVKSPIFLQYQSNHTPGLSQNVHRAHLHESIPRLADIKGFAKAYPAEQIYQDISYWIANILNPSPDVQPAGRPPQTDKEKSQSHGFDEKISFRHRC